MVGGDGTIVDTKVAFVPARPVRLPREREWTSSRCRPRCIREAPRSVSRMGASEDIPGVIIADAGQEGVPRQVRGNGDRRSERRARQGDREEVTVVDRDMGPAAPVLERCVRTTRIGGHEEGVRGCCGSRPKGSHRLLPTDE